MPAGEGRSGRREEGLRASLKETLGPAAELSCATPVTRAIGLHPGVWRLTLSDGRQLAARHLPLAALLRGAPHDPLSVEPEVCRLLADAPVPNVLGVDAGRCVVFYDWYGDDTLDDVCQLDDPSVHRAFAASAIEGFSLVRSGFARHREVLGQRAFPGCGPDDLQAGWQAVVEDVRRDLPLVCDRFGLSGRAGDRVAQAVGRLADELGRARPSLGVTDYNARNVVVDRETSRIRFIELGKIGWDWDERRLVQYTTGMGGGLEGGRFRSLLTPETASSASTSGEDGRRLDGHHLMFHLIAAVRLCGAMADAAGGRPSELLRYWRDPERRLRELRGILSVPLSGDPLTGAVREVFRE